MNILRWPISTFFYFLFIKGLESSQAGRKIQPEEGGHNTPIIPTPRELDDSYIMIDTFHEEKRVGDIIPIPRGLEMTTM